MAIGHYESAAPVRSSRDRALGYAYVIGATLPWSTVPICVKIAQRALDSYTICWLRFAVGALILVAVARFRGANLRIGRGNLRMAALAAVGIGINYVFYIRGIQDTTASAANIIVQFEVISLVIASYFWLGERMGAAKVAGMLVTFAGMFLAMWNGESLQSLVSSSHFRGNLLILIGAPAWAVYAIGQKILSDRGVGVQTSLAWMFGIAALVTLPTVVVGFSLHGPVTFAVVSSLLVLVVISTVGSYVMIAKGLTLLDASTAGMITCLLPIITLVSAHFMLNEPLTAAVVGGAVLVVLGICVIGCAESCRAGERAEVRDEGIGRLP